MRALSRLELFVALLADTEQRFNPVVIEAIEMVAFDRQVVPTVLTNPIRPLHHCCANLHPASPA
jgi:hypothetical protein